jgi:group I intron endonuclease
MRCGIYKIINTATNKIYVGSSKNIEVRIRSHFSNLKNKKHHSVKLQRAYDKYGLSSFSHQILELCEIEDLFVREQHWIDSLDSYHSGYNASESSVYPTNKHSFSILDKNSKHIETIIYNLIEIQDLKDSIPTDIQISCLELGAYSDGKLKFIKYIKATEILKEILLELPELDNNLEYQIGSISYKPDAISKFRISPVSPKSQLKKIHDMFKTNYIYDQLVQMFISEICSNKYGQWVMDEMARRGVSFDEFRSPMKTW